MRQHRKVRTWAAALDSLSTSAELGSVELITAKATVFAIYTEWAEVYWAHLKNILGSHTWIENMQLFISSSTYIFLEFSFLCLQFFLGFLESFGRNLEPLHLVLKPHHLPTCFTHCTLISEQCWQTLWETVTWRNTAPFSSTSCSTLRINVPFNAFSYYLARNWIHFWACCDGVHTFANRFWRNLSTLEYIVSSWPWQIFGAICAVVGIGQRASVFSAR